MNDASPMMALRLILGLALSSTVGLLAFRRRSLTPSGVIGAIVTGTLIFGLGGIASGILLVVFFTTSSALSHFRAVHKRAVAEAFDKGTQRDMGQALANGGVAALCATCSGLALLAGGSAQLLSLCLAATVGALATANADTWATELGVLSRTPPRLITHPSTSVEAGTSGGITAAGTLAAAAGAVVIALSSLLLYVLSQTLFSKQQTVWAVFGNSALVAPVANLVLAVAGFAGGMAGAVFDSLLGATVQAIYFSHRRGKQTEKSMERDGSPNRLLRGWKWLTNDWVNFISTVAGAAVSSGLFLALAAIYGA